MRMLAIAWDPIIGLPEAITLGLGFVVAGVWLAWAGNSGARGGLRASLTGLRAGALGLVALLWLNPGRWQEESLSNRREWQVLVDRSASMNVEQDPGKTRWTAATEAAGQLQSTMPTGRDLHLRPYSNQLEEEATKLGGLVPDGKGTDLSRAISSMLDQPAAVAGLVVVSDGRQTAQWKPDELGRKARARGIPIHVVPVGANWGSRDLIITAVQKKVTAFKGQATKVTATVENRGLGAIKPVVILSGPDGKEIARKDVALDENAPGNLKSVTFELPANAQRTGEFTLRADVWPGEQIPGNNQDVARLDVIESKTRVLLLEGAPYWDSKFLAQLLRQQGAVDILTIHRLNEERYFRVEAGGAEPLQSPDSVFPKTAEELRRYDLIVFGKGADGFLDPARAAAVQAFVRDQGGAVLFARGKPYRGRFAPLENLESVEWGEPIGATVRFTPLTDAGAGLFGGSLPGVNERIWSVLPQLEDARGIAKLKPFARVLAEGSVEGRQAKVPLLIARRYGRGMVATVNADGLWRWDFSAEGGENAAIYQDFWVQLMQWCATYSDFRPGQDYAARVREAAVQPGQPARVVIAYRGAAEPAPKPVLKVLKDGKVVSTALATPLPESDGSREWVAAVTVPEPGRYDLRVADESRPGKEEGEAVVTAVAPPSEMDDLRPDTEILSALAREGGGQVWQPNALAGLSAEISASSKAQVMGKAEWTPLWPKWWVALLVVCAFGTEWWLRRREGLL